MATPYREIFDRARFRIKDKKLACLDMDDQEFMLCQYLRSAVADFQNKCKVDLTDRDEVTREFNNTLDDEIQEILALGISYYWLSSQILNSDLLMNRLSTKDYTYFSPANLMREVGIVRDEVRKEYKNRIINYTYDHGDIAMGN